MYLPDIKPYHKATVIKTAWFGHRNIPIALKNKRGQYQINGYRI